MKIQTKFTSNGSGRSQVVAKCNGKQKTTNWDASQSTDWNHGNAAGELLISGKFEGFMISLTHAHFDFATHESNDSGTVHTFNI